MISFFSSVLGVQKIGKNVKTIVVNHVSFRMIHVKGWDFYMGSQDSDNFACNYQETVNYDESPVHQMKVSSFWIGRQKSLKLYGKPL